MLQTGERMSLKKDEDKILFRFPYEDSQIVELEDLREKNLHLCPYTKLSGRSIQKRICYFLHHFSIERSCLYTATPK